MTTEEKHLDDMWFDASKYDTLKLCPQKYAYRYEQHLVPINAYSTALSFGSAIHKALETFYNGSAFVRVECPKGPCEICHSSNSVSKIAAEFMKAYPKDPDNEGISRSRQDPRTTETGLNLLGSYAAKWKREAFEVIGVEIPFEIPFGPRRKVVGKIDVLIRDGGRLKPLDHKTASRFGDLFLRGFKLSTQMAIYMYATEQITGEKVDSAIINGLRVSNNVDPEDSFLRLETSRTPEDFERMIAEVNEAFDRVIKYRATNFWPRSAPFACSAYNRECEYYSLCIAGSETRKTLMESAYKVEPWHPHGSED